MKKLTIYDVYVKMQDQAQCDRMLQLCKDYNLPYWKHSVAFWFHQQIYGDLFFRYSTNNELMGDFGVYYEIGKKTEVTEEQFIQMLKDREI